MEFTSPLFGWLYLPAFFPLCLLERKEEGLESLAWATWVLKISAVAHLDPHHHHLDPYHHHLDQPAHFEVGQDEPHADLFNPSRETLGWQQ